MSFIRVDVGGRTVRVALLRSGEGVWVGWPGRSRYLGPEAAGSAAPEAQEREIRAPMTGRVATVGVRPGDRVGAHDVLVILEAMKIEYKMTAPRAGVVEAVNCRPGGQVDLGQVLVRLSP